MNRRSVLWLLLAVPVFGQELKSPLPLPEPLRDKNFFLLSLLERTAEVRRALEADTVLSQLAAARADALHAAAAECTEGIDCLLSAMRISDDEMAAATTALRRLSESEPALQAMLTGPLRQSGAYARWRDLAGPGLIEAAWLDSAHGINRVIDVYGSGKPPRYPAIDSVSFDVHSKAYRQMLLTAVDLMDERRGTLRLFFQAPLEFALRLLELNHRDEAARFEPLEAGENAAAFRRASGVDWNAYPYTAIVVPGSGSDRITWNLSGAGRMRCELAARRYRENKAPFVIVSGGFVHPDQTPHNEALEMKKVLIRDFQVPAEAIIIEPHARHTTTNLRNAARLIFRYNIPFDKKALIVTDRFQSASIESETFTKRCLDELGYQPFRLLGRTSLFELEFLPVLESLQIDPTDPLDP